MKTMCKGVQTKDKKPLLTIEDIQLYIYELEQENKQLQERFNNLKEEYKDRTDTVHDLYERIDKAVEKLKLCNSKCAKETIEILKGE